MISQRNSEVSASKSVSEWWVEIKKPAAIFLPFLILLKNHPCYYFVKLVDSKVFTTFLMVCKKRTRDAEIRPFCPGFCLKSLSFLTFSGKRKNQGSFCKCLIINEVLFLCLTEHGGSYENGACFYLPPFLSGKITLKILTLQTYLVGGRRENAGKFLSASNGLLGFLPTFYPQKSSNLTEVVGEDKKS